MSEPKINLLIRNKLKYFKFLLDKGFEVTRTSSFLDSLGNWFIEFESPDCFIMVLSDRDEVLVSLYPVKSNRKLCIALQPLIFYLSGGKTLIGNYEGNLAWGTQKQLKRTSDVLEEYIDQILPYMGSKYLNYENEIHSAGDEYMRIQFATYRQKTNY